MTSAELRKLLKMSRNQKIKLVKTLWSDIARDQNDLRLPKEHSVLLERRLGQINKGISKFRNWDEVKKKYFAKSKI
jgi:putative addiction module component (TIGR02574 family)